MYANLDYPSFQRFRSTSAVETGYEPYNLNPLLKWPLIKIREGSFITPSPRDVLERASSGIYYDLMPADQGRFGAVLGDAFQEYVGVILAGLPGLVS